MTNVFTYREGGGEAREVFKDLPESIKTLALKIGEHLILEFPENFTEEDRLKYLTMMTLSGLSITSCVTDLNESQRFLKFLNEIDAKKALLVSHREDVNLKFLKGLNRRTLFSVLAGGFLSAEVTKTTLYAFSPNTKSDLNKILSTVAAICGGFFTAKVSAFLWIKNQFDNKYFQSFIDSPADLFQEAIENSQQFRKILEDLDVSILEEVNAFEDWAKRNKIHYKLMLGI